MNQQNAVVEGRGRPLPSILQVRGVRGVPIIRKKRYANDYP
jgi:hypothetical protein